MTRADRTRFERLMLRLMPWYDEPAAAARDEAADMILTHAARTRSKVADLRTSARAAAGRLAR